MKIRFHSIKEAKFPEKADIKIENATGIASSVMSQSSGRNYKEEFAMARKRKNDTKGFQQKKIQGLATQEWTRSTMQMEIMKLQMEMEIVKRQQDTVKIQYVVGVLNLFNTIVMLLSSLYPKISPWIVLMSKMIWEWMTK